MVSVVILPFVVLVGTPAPSGATTPAPVSGTGSSYASPAIETWVSQTAAAPYNLSVNFAPSDSGTGRYEFTNQTTDFAVSDIGYVGSTDATPPSFPFMFVPLVAAGIAFMYNVPGLSKQLQLSSLTACGLLTGGIKNWNDPHIAADNPGVSLPSVPVIPVTESDSAGTNYVLEEWCIAEQPALWAAFVQAQESQAGGPTDGVVLSPTSPNSNWPGIAGGLDDQKTSSVASDVANRSGGVGAVQMKYAQNQLGFGGTDPSKNVALVKNASGDYTAPTPVDVTSALAYATQQANGTHQLDFNGAGPHVYNPSTYSYLLVPTTGWSPSKGDTMSQFVNYVLTIGQQTAPSFGYASLGLSLEQYGINAVQHNVPGAVAPTAAEQQAYACGDLTPAEVAAGQTTPTCGSLPLCGGGPPRTNSDGTVSCVYLYTGGEQTFSVPGGDSSITASVVGASGSGGARGASVSGNVTVTPGSTLYVEVGGLPFNGGGTSYSGDGGGASDIQTQSMGTAVTGANGANWASALGSRLIVAGGGGGPGGAAPSNQDNGFAGTSGVGGAGGQSGQDGQSVTGATCQVNTDHCTPVTYPGGPGGLPGENVSPGGNGQGASVANPGGFFNPPVTAYSLGGAGGGGYTGGAAGTSGSAGPSNAGGLDAYDEAGAGGGGGGSSFVGGEETVGSPAAVGAPAEVIITFVPGADPPAVTPEVPTVMMLPTAGVLVLGGWFLVARRRRSKEAVETP